MSSGDGSSTWFEGPSGPTPQQDAEDFALLLREARESQGVSVAELAQRTGASSSEILEFEAGRVIPALPPFTRYMRALGFVA